MNLVILCDRDLFYTRLPPKDNLCHGTENFIDITRTDLFLMFYNTRPPIIDDIIEYAKWYDLPIWMVNYKHVGLWKKMKSAI